MARYLIIEGGVAVNCIEADSQFAKSIGAVPAGDAGIGWLWDGKAFAPPPPPAPPARTRADVLADLAAIDTRSIRALREGNATRIAELEAQAVALRQELAGL